MQHEVTATCSTHSSWQKSFNFEIKLEKRRFTFFFQGEILGSVPMGRWRRGHFSRPGLFWVMGNGENNVSPIFHLTNRWRGGTLGAEREEKKRGGLGVEKKRNRGHWSSSTMHHAQQQRVGYRVGGKEASGSPMLSAAWMYVHWQEKNTISRVDRRKSRLTEHPQCSVRLQNMYMQLFQQQNEAERREKEVICSVEIQSDLHSHLRVCIHMEIIELFSSGEKASTWRRVPTRKAFLWSPHHHAWKRLPAELWLFQSNLFSKTNIRRSREAVMFGLRVLDIR